MYRGEANKANQLCQIQLWLVHSFFFIRTSNFDAEAERSYIFWRFEAETFLKMFFKNFLSPDDFDGVEVILEQL